MVDQRKKYDRVATDAHRVRPASNVSADAAAVAQFDEREGRCQQVALRDVLTGSRLRARTSAAVAAVRTLTD